MSSITERVERGAALLDEKRPGWWRDTDLATLDIRSPCGCILGQLGTQLGDEGRLSRFATGLDAVCLDGPEARDYGFDWGVEISDDAWEAEAERLVGGECAALTAAWRDLIISRRTAAEVTSC